MLFINNTPFPAIAWYSKDKNNKDYTSLVARGCFLFDEIADSGLWSLKLDQEQGDLFSEDIFYEGTDSSVLFESDFVAFKPNTDIVINANTHSSEAKPEKYWDCGFQLIRFEKNPDGSDASSKIIVNKYLHINGPRNWLKISGKKKSEWKLSEPEAISMLPIRYEYAYGGVIPKSDDPVDPPEYSEYFKQNPIGIGIVHDLILNGDEPIPAPQIEAPNRWVTEIETRYEPEGMGFVNRCWESRLRKAGTFDVDWQNNKCPIMPDDFNESYFNGAPENQQVKGYIQVDDLLLLERLQTGHDIQAFKIPKLYLKGKYHINKNELPFLLDIDTLVVDLRAEHHEDWLIYISWRKRMPLIHDLEMVSLGLIAEQEYLEFVT